MMAKNHKILLTIYLFLFSVGIDAQVRYWQAQDGLPTGEVRQIVALPNHQMLVNCEGVFCLSNGIGFSPVPCDRRRTYQMEHYADSVGYGYQWQGDSLLWLHDFYRIYLFDMRTRSFRYDIEERLHSLGRFISSPDTIKDWQGGTWTGTLSSGIAYMPPVRPMAITGGVSDSLVAIARKTENLDIELSDGRRLQSRGLNQLGYFLPNENLFISLNDRLAQLNDYRHIVGACAVDRPWVVLYTQNGACMLDVEADTLAAFWPAETIGEYTDKYNCMVLGRDGTLWIGTQNGLFQTKRVTERSECEKVCTMVEGLSNNCIRSLVIDSQGNIWAGTACGISRITPSVINFGEEDCIPAVSMMERAACQTDDGRLVFVHHSSVATVFRPEWLNDLATPCTPVLTSFLVNGHDKTCEQSERMACAYNENYLTFLFSSLDYARPSHVFYRFRLCGLEEDWHISNESDGIAVADYKALSPGEYIFEAQAASSDSEWSDTLTFHVTINPPFWLTWWAKLFYCLIIVMALMLLVGLYIRRKREKLERENDNRVNQLFELREEARHQFAENTRIDPQKIGINEDEEKLISRLLTAVEAHLDDTNYNVDQLASDVCLSRTNLYGKLRNMLGISPADFIRNVRLKRSAQLLTDNPSLSINEVSDLVGFVTPRNFSVQFKKMFGVLPSEYRSLQKTSM